METVKLEVGGYTFYLRRWRYKDWVKLINDSMSINIEGTEGGQGQVKGRWNEEIFQTHGTFYGIKKVEKDGQEIPITLEWVEDLDHELGRILWEKVRELNEKSFFSQTK